MSPQPLPSLELREVFSKITLEQVQEMAASIASSNSKPELEATLRESAAAMPIVNEVQRVIQEHKSAGNVQQESLAQGQLIFLMSLYRLAEDQGYVW